MKIPRDSNIAALVACFGGVYPVALLSQALGWPHAVQFALGLLCLLTLTGVKLWVVRRNRRIGLDAAGRPRHDAASYPRRSEWTAPTDTTATARTRATESRMARAAAE